MCQPTRITTSGISHMYAAGRPSWVGTVVVCWLIIAHSSGTDMYTLWRERVPARLTIAGSGGVPSFTAVMIFCCEGQMRDQTLNAMIVPNIAARWMLSAG